MAWYSWLAGVPGAVADLTGLDDKLYDGIKGAYNTVTGDDSAKNAPARAGLAQNGLTASNFADYAAGGYRLGGDQIRGANAMLYDQAQGRNSLVSEQLRQGLAAQRAQQQSMAAGAAPRDAAMMARTAAIQGGRASSAMAGQAAMAKIQEQTAARQALAQSLLAQRGQDLQGTLGGFNASNQAYGASINPNDDKSWSEKNAALLSGISSAASLSDERHKTKIKKGDDKASALLEGLKAYSFEYKKGARRAGAGDGEQLGVMAQDLEKVAPHAVIDTPGGKMVHGAKLATTLAAALAGVHKRVRKLEDDE